MIYLCLAGCQCNYSLRTNWEYCAKKWAELPKSIALIKFADDVNCLTDLRKEVKIDSYKNIQVFLYNLRFAEIYNFWLLMLI